MCNVAGELKETGQRLLTAHTGASRPRTYTHIVGWIVELSTELIDALSMW